MEMKLTVPPKPCPDQMKTEVEKWDKPNLDILVHHGVPWWILYQLGRDGWTTASTFVDRWDSVDDLVNGAKTELDFRPNG